MGKQIGLISDVHYHSDFDEQVEEGLKEFSDTMDDLGVENIYVLGDLILEENRKSDIEAFERVSDMLDTSAFDCTYLCGNHDLINVSRDEFLDIIDQERTYGVHDHKNGSIVYLDSVKQGDVAGRIDSNQKEMVRKYCKNRDKLVLLSHHPLTSYDLCGNEWFSEKPQDAVCRNYYDIYDLIDFNKVLCCISGHIHQESVKRGLTDWYSHQAFARRTRGSYDRSIPSPPVTGAYSLFRLRNNGVDLHQYY